MKVCTVLLTPMRRRLREESEKCDERANERESGISSEDLYANIFAKDAEKISVHFAPTTMPQGYEYAKQLWAILT